MKTREVSGRGGDRPNETIYGHTIILRLVATTGKNIRFSRNNPMESPMKAGRKTLFHHHDTSHHGKVTGKGANKLVVARLINREGDGLGFTGA